MFTTIINDCKSQNDRGRLETRYATLFPGVHISFIGVDSNLGLNATLEAAGNLVDILDASDGKEGVVAVNVAPRGQVRKDGENGSSFCYFFHKKTLVIATIKGYNLSLVKKLGIAKEVFILDTKEFLDFVSSRELINTELCDYIVKSQFRSFDFQPRVSRWLVDKENIPAKRISIEEIPNAPSAVWLVDSFGNIKTTLLKEDLPLKEAPLKVKTNLGSFKFYERLKDVPDGETAIYIGSSGIGNRRFLEIATQNRTGSAEKILGLEVGDAIRIEF